MNYVKDRKGRWNNAYVICSYFSFKQVELIGRRLDAELVHIDTDKETCLKRLYENGDGRDIVMWENYIDVYFKNIIRGEIL